METKGYYWYCWGLLNLRMCFIPGDWQCESEITQDLAAKLVDGISTQWRVSTISPAKKTDYRWVWVKSYDDDDDYYYYPFFSDIII